MKRLQILIDEDLDAELERLSNSEGRSKASLIREFVRNQVKPMLPLDADPIWQMAGRYSFEPVDPTEIDDIVYGDAGKSDKPQRAIRETARATRRRRAK
jgi:Ribbon-helix-helix protein, copG family